MKPRKIQKADWTKLETHINNELDSRKKSTYRTDAERKWKEIDRQLAMNPMQRVNEVGQPLAPSWHNVFELGELSKSLEIICDDVMRMIFPQDRRWFDPHTETESQMDEETGERFYDANEQEQKDSLLRSFMAQQQKDFGFKNRFKLGVTESLAHGSVVFEVRWEQQPMVWEGSRVKYLAAPVLQPYSMWNAYPDPSPSIIGTNLFYTGAMILEEYMPLWRLRQIASGEGWMPDRLKKVPKDTHKVKDVETSDVRLTKWYGDLVIERGDGDMYFPNSKAILANGVIVYMSPNELPYPSIIYTGYQRQDVRDPYYTSPIIKQSPMQKFTTIMANKFADATELKVEPPIEYDANDPDYVANDGPTIAPGAKTPTRSMGKGFKALDIGDPAFALNAVELGLRQLQEGTGVSSIRSGVASSDRQTATEIVKQGQGAEVRTVAFVEVLGDTALMPWLYMQHELNRQKLEDYWFYCDDMNTQDFVRVTREDLPPVAMFDVVGAKGLLGEEQRTQKVMNVHAFASQNPLFAPRLKPEAILLDAYRDAGLKNPEKFVNTQEAQPDPALTQKVQELEQALAETQAELQKARQENEADAAEVQAESEKDAAELALKARDQQFNHALMLRDQQFKESTGAGLSN